MENGDLEPTQYTEKDFIYIYQIKCLDCTWFKNENSCAMSNTYKKRFCDQWRPLNMPPECFGYYREYNQMRKNCENCGYKEECVIYTISPHTVPIRIKNLKRLVDGIGTLDCGSDPEKTWRWL
jgi:hypothetical protein